MTKFEPFTERQPIESVHSFGVRVLKHAMTFRILEDVSTEGLELAAHVASAYHTEGSTDAIVEAVKRIRTELTHREALAEASPKLFQLPMPTIELDGNDDGGSKVRRPKRVPPMPPMSSVADPF